MPVSLDIPVSFAMFPPIVVLDSFAIPFSFSSWLKLDSLEISVRNPNLFSYVAVTENRVELHPGHVGLGDEGLVAAGAFRCRCFLGPRGVRKRMMPEVEEAPAIGRSEPLAILHRDIHAVVFAVEKSPARGFRARTVGKGWV